MPDITLWEIAIGLLAGVLIGLSKTGFATISIFSIVMMSQIFPAKEASGIILVMLIAADIIAVVYYRRNVVWSYLLSLLPWVMIGLVVGYYVLDQINNSQLQIMLGVLILSLIVLNVCRERLGEKLNEKLPQSIWFTSSMGILAGFATMVGNVAASVMVIYFLAKGLPKKEFIGTGAWFFFVVNLIKVPFLVDLGLITMNTLAYDTWFLPGIIAGAVIGIKLLPYIPQKQFQHIILVLASVGALRLIIF
ncbi:sulfite exporter TauE/SafE family protein [Ammoniphilus resinae]|uniref:Probable membrane transporter protein n=1 Tax=Ammoniphilus resinae TaxID=861532 RepID=A0ABS4GVF2_9BACL|nr:sulfite exporter TauE/SafE family protein [Ammoniphilus resinae]MBP1934250.1 putative membrane protein YfcA [Ammoniphilus resinae]